MRPTNLLLTITIVVLFAVAANAQTTATVSGKVEDATGAAVSGANITVKSLETGVTRVATTDDTGHFRAIFLSVGRQEVKAEKEGFKSGVRSGINLEVGQEAVVNFQLEIGELLQEVRIVSEAPVVNTTTA